MRIKGHLLTMTVIVVTPLAVFAAIAAGLLVREQRSAIQSRLREAARAIARDVDHELATSITTLETLAASVDVDPVGLNRLRRAGSAIVGAQRRWRGLILADVSGRQLVAISSTPAAALPGVGDRPTFGAVVQTGQPQVSRVLATPPDRDLIVVVGVPVTVDREVRHVLLAALDAHVLADVVGRHDVPDGWLATIVDQTGAVVAGSRGPDRPAAARDSAVSYTAQSRSTAGPWLVTVSAAASTLSPAPAPWIVVGAGVMAVLSSLGLALVYRRRLAGPVRSLASYAEVVDRREAATPPAPSAIEEIDRAVRTLADRERLQAEQAVRDRQQIFDALPCASWLVEPSTLAIVAANEAARRAYGYSRDDVVGMTWGDLWPPEGRADAPDAETLLARPGVSHPCRHRAKDGSLLDVELRVQPVVFDDRRLILVVAADVTGLRRVDRERLQQLALAQAGRAEAEATAAAAGERAARQELLAELTIGVVQDVPLGQLLHAGLARLAAVLHVEYAEFLELLPDRSAFLLRAGFGWKAGQVGHATVPAGKSSPAGYAVLSGSPVIVGDLAHETRFPEPALHRDHGVVSGASVVVGGGERPFGVLGVHTTRRRSLAPDDARLLQTVAGVLASAIERQRGEEARQRLLRIEQAARAAAEGSVQQYRLLSETIPQIVWTSRVDGWVDYFNERFKAYTGLSLEESEGWRWQSTLHPEDTRRCLQRWNNALATGDQLEVECRVKGKDGVYRWHLLRALPVREPETAGVKSWLGTFTDIDDQKRAEKERQRLLDAEQAARAEAQLAERRASFLSEASRILGSSLDCETTLARLVRLAVAEIGDWCAVDIVAEDGSLQRLALAHLDPTMEEVGEQLRATHGARRVLATGRAEFYPDVPARLWESETPDAEAAAIFQKLRSAMVVPLAARERVLGTMTFLAGESGRPYTPADLALAEELALRAALAFDNACLYTEADRRRREAQELARVAAGLTESLDAKVLAQRLVEALLPLFGVRWAALRLLQPDGALKAIAVAGQAPEHFEVGHPGARAASFRADREIVGVLSVGDDKPRDFSGADVSLLQTFAHQAAVVLLNAHLYAEAQRGRQEAELAHAEAEAANRAKDAFLATLSHELRTPLTAMLGWARMLRTGRLDPPEAARAVDILERNTRVQAQLIEDLLDISRIISGKLHLDLGPVSLDGVVRDAVDSMRQTAEAKGIQIALAVDGTAGVVEADRARLQQVVSNLLSNAIKFTPAGGQVQVRLERAGAEAHVIVSDTGPGIDPDFLPRIFDRFRQADSSTTSAHGGLGLGLAIVRHLVELHGGTVSAANRDDRAGAMFAVRLPLVASEPGAASRAAATAQGPATVPTPALAGVRILVVEDDRDTREFVCTALAACSADVTAVASADEALARLEKGWPDVILSDVKMPGMDGYELIRRIRAQEAQRGERALTIALTAYANADERASLLGAGFDIHVAKPVDPDDLAATIGRVLCGPRGDTRESTAA